MEPAKPIRTLIIDDSAAMRSLLRMTLSDCPRVEIIGVAVDGRAGLTSIEKLKPQLVLLDIEMPGMNGLDVLREIYARSLPVRVIMCSTLTRRGAGITLEALARGAADYVAKPTAQRGLREGVETLRGELIPKIHALFPAIDGRNAMPAIPAPAHTVSHPPLNGGTCAWGSAGVLVVGVSTGGPAALERFVPALPADFPLPVLIVQHMPALFTALLAQRLNTVSNLTVREAIAGEILAPGTAFLARGDRHMRIACAAGRCSVRLTLAEPDEICRPSVDVLFRSAAATYGTGVLAVMLTGMGADGLDGCRAIHAAGGRIFVQDRETSAVWGMPGVVAAAGLAERVLPLDALAAEVVHSAGRQARTMSA
jgi:two-component system, chemotaxis family, protein-glutamate methylesterase/glutaminase